MIHLALLVDKVCKDAVGRVGIYVQDVLLVGQGVEANPSTLVDIGTQSLDVQSSCGIISSLDVITGTICPPERWSLCGKKVPMQMSNLQS